MKDFRVLSGTRTLPRSSTQSLAGRLVRECLPVLGGGFVLAGARLFGEPLPLAACLIAALPMGKKPAAAAIGAVAGYIALCESAAAAQYTAVSILMLAALAIFQGTRLPATRWFMPCMAAGVNALLGGILGFGAEGGFGLWLAGCLLAGLCTAAFRSALGGNRNAAMVLTGALICGLSGMPFDLGLFAASALACATSELYPATVAGLALELTGGYGMAIAAAFPLPALFCRMRGVGRYLSLLAYALVPNLVLLCFGAASIPRCALIVLGAVGGEAARRFRLLPRILTERGEGAARAKLENAADILAELRCQLPEKGEAPGVSEAESVYNGAADRVCRCCARFHRCWQHRAGETYRALSGAAGQIIERGVARQEDFPLAFRDSCCHLDGFVTAINQELEGMLYRRRYRMQLAESRRVVAEELECISEYLRAEAVRAETDFSECAFAPSIGICSVGKGGSKRVGDRGACFAGEDGSFFVLLCDGMGTGEGASRLSGETVRLLERLLRSGLAPEGALKIMNGMELLRGTGSFTTVDLLHTDLRSGSAMLYKWGGAPSYLRSGDAVKKIGTAVPPPGVGVGGDHLPERFKLSLKWGEMLILISDGAGGEETEEAIASYRGQSPRELAAILVAGASDEDDKTAVCVSLRPRVS